MANLDRKTVEGFGDEWSRFDQSALSPSERDAIFADYFEIFPWDMLPADAQGFDMGCGSGRWAQLVAPRVGVLHCVDPSAAIEIAKRNLKQFNNVEFHHTDLDEIDFAENSMDFGYSLGVLHHVPDTRSALIRCVNFVKIGSPFLLYFYYNFDNRPKWYYILWKVSDFMRKFISKLPHWLRYFVSQVIAATVYWPLSRLAKLADRIGIPSDNFPLSFYKDLSFYTMQTDALDRFGTRLEQRFSKAAIAEMMAEAGLSQIEFSPKAPYWCAVGIKVCDGTGQRRPSVI